MPGNIFPVSTHSTLLKKVANFPEDVYNFNEGDFLTTLMTILLGNSGTGQLKNIQTVARLGQEIIEFDNLDNILGQIFNMRRISSEIYSFATNPFIDQLEQTQWQEIVRKDANYRERLLGAAEAYQNGATLWAILTLCEASTGMQFYAVEGWRTPGYGRTGVNHGQEIVLMPLSDGSFFTWDQSKAQAILQVIQNIIPSNFIISFGPVQQTMTRVPLTSAVVSGYDVNNVPSTMLEPAGYSEYFYLQPLVTAQNIVTPANIPIGASTRYWLVNGMQVTAPYFAHLQTQESVIDVTGNISSVSCTDLNGTNAPSESVAQASLQVTATLYGAQ
jgi:hypothetical protein